jgi:hypothetical protein
MTEVTGAYISVYCWQSYRSVDALHVQVLLIYLTQPAIVIVEQTDTI